MVEVINQLSEKKMDLRVLDCAIDTTSAQGRLQLNILTSIAQFEREVMLERQREGIARAKADGKYKGRKRSIDYEEVRLMLLAKLSPTDIARKLGINRVTVYKVKKKLEESA